MKDFPNKINIQKETWYFQDQPVIKMLQNIFLRISLEKMVYYCHKSTKHQLVRTIQLSISLNNFSSTDNELSKQNLNPRKAVVFLRRQRPGGMDSTANLATLRSSNLTHLKVGHILSNWPMTILNRYKLFFSQSKASVNFVGPWNALDRKIQIFWLLVTFHILVFFPQIALKN